MFDYAVARRAMVDSQIKTNKVTDERLIAALEDLPREQFLPKPLRSVAYLDEDIPLGSDRYLMEPMVLARLIQAARVTASDVALDIGCGPGYATAVLARLASAVVGLDSDPTLVKEAAKRLAELGLDTAVVVEGPLDAGYPAQAPYDVIFFGGAVDQVPEAVQDQLAEGGRLVAVVVDPARSGPQPVGRATLIERRHGLLSHRVLFDSSIPRLPGLRAEPGFVF